MDVGMWLSLTCEDADAMMRWLTVLGFEERAVFREERDPSFVQNAEYRWAKGGGVMLSTSAERSAWPVRPGTAAVYLLCDDPDELHARALAAGGTSLREPEDQDYGGRVAVVRDPEGNLWSVGTYAGV